MWIRSKIPGNIPVNLNFCESYQKGDYKKGYFIEFYNTDGTKWSYNKKSNRDEVLRKIDAATSEYAIDSFIVL